MTASPLRLVNWRSTRRSTQIGIGSVMLLDLLLIPEITLHFKGERYWAQLPRGLRWRSPAVADRFNKALLELLRQHRPDALGGPLPLLQTQLQQRLTQ
jgi:hypothetical protein